MDKPWKVDERKICGLFGGVRRGPDAIGQSDCVDTPLGIQIKRSKRGSILTKWVNDAKEQAQKEGKPWLLVVRSPGTRIGTSTATMELSYLLEILRGAGILPAQIVQPKQDQPSDSAPTVNESKSKN